MRPIIIYTTRTETAYGTPRTCCPNTQNMLSEHLEHVARTPGKSCSNTPCGAVARCQRALCLALGSWCWMSCIMFRMFQQYGQGVQTICSSGRTWYNIFEDIISYIYLYLCLLYKYASNNNLYGKHGNGIRNNHNMLS